MTDELDAEYMAGTNAYDPEQQQDWPDTSAEEYEEWLYDKGQQEQDRWNYRNAEEADRHAR